MSATAGTKAVVAALLANCGIAVTKFGAYALTGSSSMLAEAIHSVADSGNQVLLLVGAKKSTRAATETHPFGYGRERYVYSFIVAVVLFVVGGLFALYEAWHKWSDPHAITEYAWVPVVVLIAAIIMESFSLRTAVQESNPLRGQQSWWRFIRTSRTPELPVILLEDLAALLGLIFALFGVSMTLLTDDGRWDAFGTALIGVLLIAVAAILAVEMKSLLVGEGATPAELAAVTAALPGPGVASIIHLRTLYLGPDELLVAAKIEVEGAATAADVAAAIDAAEVRLREAVPQARVIYLEPDLRRSV